MKNFSDVNVTRVAIGYILMLVYAGYSLCKWNNSVNSQSFLGMAGVVIIGLSVAAGLGFCALIGLPFNASTTQVIIILTKNRQNFFNGLKSLMENMFFCS